jgi:membrane fusion protein, copper/silver efflux system
MTHRTLALLTVTALAAAGSAGFWVGRHGLEPGAMVGPREAISSPLRTPNGPVVYYRDPDGKPLYSVEPKQTSDGRQWRAVHASEDPALSTRLPRQASRRNDGSSITAIRWAFPIFRLRQRKIRWGWTTSPSMRARMTTGLRSR